MKKELLEILVQSVDLKKLANGVVDNVIEEALKKVVASTTNPFDDMAMASLWPVLEVEVKKLIEEKLDLTKILGLDAE
tara:strand:+ start:296 stop:529 length:234 start_codon:yes stop_codon:yes gene_type:complete